MPEDGNLLHVRHREQQGAVRRGPHRQQLFGARGHRQGKHLAFHPDLRNLRGSTGSPDRHDGVVIASCNVLPTRGVGDRRDSAGCLDLHPLGPGGQVPEGDCGVLAARREALAVRTEGQARGLGHVRKLRRLPGLARPDPRGAARSGRHGLRRRRHQSCCCRQPLARLRAADDNLESTSSVSQVDHQCATPLPGRLCGDGNAVRR
mmetsp:Transcript_104753/g.323062  ORF Transcript_104753/g.323062 Transcript_104753/m.323062 type:complete len:205 (-) Transcript_104753:199-813(-)